MKNLYATLGLNPNATQDEIKKAYRAAALKFHPDVNNNPVAEYIFREIKEAYEILSNQEKRNAYDVELYMSQEEKSKSMNKDINLQNYIDNAFNEFIQESSKAFVRAIFNEIFPIKNVRRKVRRKRRKY